MTAQRTRAGGDRRNALALLGAGLAGAAVGGRAVRGRKRCGCRRFPATRISCGWRSPRPQKPTFLSARSLSRDGKVLAAGRNLGTTTNDPTAHGEMVAIRRFVASRPAEELKGTTLYTSGEPCPMCMGAILWCGIGRVVFAASIEELATKIGQIMLTSRTMADAAPFATIAITGGVLSAEALALFSRSRAGARARSAAGILTALLAGIFEIIRNSPCSWRLSHSTMHCSCSSGSEHCSRQASAFARQLVWQASA